MATKTWDGTTGNWSTAASWTPSGVPVANDDAVLPGNAGGYTLTFDADTAALDSLTVGSGLNGVITLALGAQTLNVNGSGSGATDAITLQEPGGVTISIAGGIVNAGTLTLGSPNDLVTGAGALAIASISGSGLLTASGGVLDVGGSVSSGVNLAVDTVAGSTLKLEGTVASASGISISNANQTLEIGTAGALTINTDETIANGTIKLDGGTASLSVTGTLGIAPGASITGAGTINAASLSGGGGTLKASGGTLILQQSLTASDGVAFQVAAGSTLQLNGQISTGNSFVFLNNAANTGVVAVGDDTGMNATFSGMFVQTGAAPSDFVDFTGKTVSIVSATGSGTNSGTITLSDGAVLNLVNITSTGWFADVASDGAGGTALFLSDTATACYCRGTLILTDRGEVPVEELAIGDRLVTISGIAKPIKWMGHRAFHGRFVAGNPEVLPIRIAKGGLADGVPARDLCVSPEHALYIDGVLVPAKHLVNSATITQAASVDQVDYFHIELDSHEILFAEGAPAESYVECDNRMMFANSAEFSMLYPQDDRPAWQYCAQVLEDGSQHLSAIHAALLERAVVLGHKVNSDRQGDDLQQLMLAAG